MTARDYKAAVSTSVSGLPAAPGPCPGPPPRRCRRCPPPTRILRSRSRRFHRASESGPGLPGPRLGPGPRRGAGDLPRASALCSQPRYRQATGHGPPVGPGAPTMGGSAAPWRGSSRAPRSESRLWWRTRGRRQSESALRVLHRGHWHSQSLRVTEAAARRLGRLLSLRLGVVRRSLGAFKFLCGLRRPG